MLYDNKLVVFVYEYDMMPYDAKYLYSYTIG